MLIFAFVPPFPDRVRDSTNRDEDGGGKRRVKRESKGLELGEGRMGMGGRGR